MLPALLPGETRRPGCRVRAATTNAQNAIYVQTIADGFMRFMTDSA